MAEELKEEVIFIGVSNRDTVEDGREYVSIYDVPYAMAHGPDVWEAYDVPYQPVTIIIDAEGAIASRIDGPVTYEDLKRKISTLLRD